MNNVMTPEGWKYWYYYKCGCKLKKKFYGTSQPEICRSCKQDKERREEELEAQRDQDWAEEALHDAGFTEGQIEGLREWLKISGEN